MSDITAKQLAVIDIGAHSIRMEIFQVDEHDKRQTLESLSQPINIGRDVFSKGSVSPRNIKLAAGIISDYARVMDEYSVSHCRAVATSAVREAFNREIFVDQVELASGIRVKVLEVGEEMKLTHLALRRALKGALSLTKNDAIVCNIGTGSMQVSTVRGALLAAASSLAVGTIRLLEEFGQGRLDRARISEITDSFTASALASVTSPDYQAPEDSGNLLIFAGAGVRTVAQIAGRKPKNGAIRLPRSKFNEVAAVVAKSNPTELAAKYSITDLAARALEPCCQIIEHFRAVAGADEIIIPEINTRDAIADELIRRLAGGDDPFEPDLLNVARNIGAKYNYDARHAEIIENLSVRIFDKLAAGNGLTPRHRSLLRVAAILHDIGRFINNRRHHKHSHYIITNTQLPGVSSQEQAIIAATARYHRKAKPKASHIEYTSLTPETRVLTNKLAAILRVADALDSCQQHKFHRIQFQVKDGWLRVKAGATVDVTVESLALERKSDLFNEVFGLKVSID